MTLPPADAPSRLRAFVPRESIAERRLTLEGADSKRLVARGARPDDVIEALDNTGWTAVVRLDSVTAARCSGTVLDRRRAGERRTKVGLFHGLLAAPDMRRMVARATAAGVVGLHPVISEGCVLPGAGTAPEDAAWAELARDAAEACGRGQFPAVAPPALLDQALDQAIRGGSLCLIVDREGAEPRDALADRPFSIALFCPPADRFTARERDLAAARGARVVRATSARGADPVATALDALQAVYGELESGS